MEMHTVTIISWTDLE